MLSPALETLRASQDRMLEREGIPMVLALVSEVGSMPTVAGDAVRAEGERLARSMDRFRDQLIPSMREEDNGCLISLLVATSYEDHA
jgi:hypothetical protein